MNIGHRYISSDGAVAQAGLRVLATTDLHMHLRAYDYLSEQQTPGRGLSRLAGVIAQARAEAGSNGCILLDNGDALQGAPMADIAAAAPVSQDHPLARVFDGLAYDAVGLGNHDLDFGLQYLADVAAQYAAPTVSSNFSSDLTPDVVPWVMIKRVLRCSDGQDRPLRVGVVSVLPPQTMIWNSHALAGRASIADMEDALRVALPAVKQAGADVVVLLAHSGLGASDGPTNAENAALHLARLDDVDVVIAGHTHDLFPRSPSRDVPGVDPVEGTLNDTPAAMPGFGGSHLAVVDLELVFRNGTWAIANHTSALRRAKMDAPEDSVVLKATASAHLSTRQHLSQKVGFTGARVHSYFSVVQSSADLWIAAEAKRKVIAATVAGTELVDLPILASAAAFASGGHGGPGNFLSFGPGDVQRRHVSRMAPYENRICASVLTGEQVRNWLERSAAIFRTMTSDDHDAMLLHADAPSFNFDVLHGVRFRIDLMEPARYDVFGQLRDATAQRILDLTFDGKPVVPTQRFLVASTHYRLCGGGEFPGCTTGNVRVQTEHSERQALEQSFRDGKNLDVTAFDTDAWYVTGMKGTTAIVETSPDALEDMHDVRRYAPVDLGVRKNGFRALRLTF